MTALPSEAAADHRKSYPASLEQLAAISCTAAMMRVGRPRGTAPPTAEDAAMETPMEHISQWVPLTRGLHSSTSQLNLSRLCH